MSEITDALLRQILVELREIRKALDEQNYFIMTPDDSEDESPPWRQ